MNFVCFPTIIFLVINIIHVTLGFLIGLLLGILLNKEK